MKLKKTLIFILLFVIISLWTSVCLANGYIPGKEEIKPELPTTEPKTAVENILGAMVFVGYAVAVGMIMFVGIKYMFASADERASTKGMFVKVVIGALIISFSSLIIDIMLSVANSV